MAINGVSSLYYFIYVSSAFANRVLLMLLGVLLWASSVY